MARLLAFDLPADDSTENHDIFALAVDGSREITVVKHPSHDSLLGWSADGKTAGVRKRPERIYERMGAAIFRMTVRRVRQSCLKRDVGAFWWSMGLSDTGALFSAAGFYDTLFNIPDGLYRLKTGKLTTTASGGGLHVRGSKPLSSLVARRKVPWLYQSRRNGVGIRQFKIRRRDDFAGPRP